MTERPSVHIIDDDEGVRDSLAVMLESKDYCVASYYSATDFIARLPDQDSLGCLLVDVRMPGMSGLELQRWTTEQQVIQPIIIMTGHGDITMAVEAMKLGAVDFIQKPFKQEQLISAINHALAICQQKLSQQQETLRLKQLIANLTERELQVFLKMAEGKPNKIIADELMISPRTLEVHRARVMTKLGSKNIGELMRIAVNAGILVNT